MRAWGRFVSGDRVGGRVDGGDDDRGDEVARADVENERSELRDFVAGLSSDQIRSGDWFTRLLSQALSTYTEKATWAYFQEKYQGVPVDAIVEQRIKLASKYAAIEGGLSAGAYTATVAATIGSLGGASPATVPAAAASMMVDVAYITRLQVRLAYDIAVLYRVPLDVSDPEDLWKLIRVAFTIKSGEAANKGAVKVAPALVRPLIKRFYSGSVLTAGKSLPVVGKFLLQRNVIKIGIPLVGVPLAVLVNRYTTLIAGRHARAVFRNDARVIELAERLSEQSRHPQLLLWVAWLVITAEGKTSDDETLLFRHLVRLIEQRHGIRDEQLAKVVEFDPDEVWKHIDVAQGPLDDVIHAAALVAAVDGEPNRDERSLLAELEERCRPRTHGPTPPEGQTRRTAASSYAEPS